MGDQASLCLDDPLIHAVLDAVDSYAMILNPQRQILAANPAFLEALSQEVLANCRGLRLGEALGCVHAGEGSDGCGTSRACGRCGSLLSILDGLMGSVGVESAARLIRLPTDPAAPLVRTDPAILCGILTHMVLNALEAVPSGGQARIWHESRAGHPTFVVQNPGCMAPEVADRIFQRSFTTKALRGRGLGTYGMKVMGETVLGGKVGFTTGWEEGTRFFVTLPESP